MAEGEGKAPLDIRHRTRKGTGMREFSGGGGFRPRPGAPPAPAGGIRGAELSRTIPPPSWIRPPQAAEINVNADGVGFNNATTPAPIPGAQFQVPVNNVGVIRSLVLSVNNMLATSQLLWQLLFDGRPVQGWSRLTIFPRAAGSVSVSYGPDETFIPVPDGAGIDVQVVVDPADGNTYQAGVSYHGWYYSKDLADAFDDVYRS